MVDESLKKIFGLNLKKARLLVAVTRRQLAKELDVSESTLGAYERGETLPSLEKILLAAELLNASLDELFGRSTGTVFRSSVAEYRFKRAIEIVRLAGLDVYELESGGYGVFEVGAVKNFAQGTGDLLKTDEDDEAIVAFEQDTTFFEFMEFIEDRTIETGDTFDDALRDVMNWWNTEGLENFNNKNKKNLH